MRLIVLLLILLLASCTTPPQPQITPQCNWPEIPNNGGCCRDLNDNNVCDTIDFASEIEAQKQQEYEIAAQKARETAESSGKYKPTIVNLLYENATSKNYRFYYKGDEVIVTNNTIVRKLTSLYPLGDKTINDRRMKVFVNTIWLDTLQKTAVAQCVPSEKLISEGRSTPCDDFANINFGVQYDVFAFKMPTKWLEDLLYRNPISVLGGSHIGDRTATLYKFTDLQDSSRKTHIWIDDQVQMPLRVEVWQNDKLVEEEDYLDFFVI